MIIVHGHHGVHISFLNYILEVMSDQRDAIKTIPNTFDWIPHKKFFIADPDGVRIKWRGDKIIWVSPHNRLFFAYNLFTRAIQHIKHDIFYTGTDSSVKKWISTVKFNFDNFTIHDWERYPTKYVLGCEMICYLYDQLASISKSDGTVEKPKMIWWYIKEILTAERYYQKFKKNVDVIEVPNSMFYDINLCEDYLKKIDKHFSLKLNFTLFEKLFDQLHSTLTYDKKSVLNDGSYLSSSYHVLGNDWREKIYPSEFFSLNANSN